MSWWATVKQWFAGPRYRVRLEGFSASGLPVVFRVTVDALPVTDEEHLVFLDRMRRMLWVEQGVRVRDLELIAACEHYDDVRVEGKVRFEARLPYGGLLTGKLPYSGTLPDWAEVRLAIARQVKVRTGQSCVEVRILGAY